MQRYFSAVSVRLDFSCLRQGAPGPWPARALAIAALSGIAGLACTANAATDSWSITPLGNTFTGNNWTVGSTVPGAPTGTIAAGDSLYFGSSNVTLLNNDEPSDFAPAGITFNSDANAFVISGNELDLSSSPVSNNSSLLQTISAPIVLNGTPTFTTNSGGTTLLSGNITGGGGITTAGTGTLILSGVDPDNPFPNSFGGTDTFNTGRVVELNSGSAVGYGSTNNIGSSAVLELKNTTTTTTYQYYTNFNGAGTIQKTGVGSVALGFSVFGPVNVSLSAGGLIDVEQGQLIGSSSGEGQWGSNQGSLKVAKGAVFDGAEASIYVDALTGSGIVQGGYNGNMTTTIGVANGSGTFTGTIQDSGDGGYGTLSLTKTGTGTETLSGDNTFTGNTIITGGSLVLTSNLALEQSILNLPATGSGASVSFSSAVTSTSIVLGGLAGSTNFTLLRGTSPASLTLTGNNNSVMTGALVGGTTLTKAGGGIQTLSGANTFTGGTTILEGGLYLDYSANANATSPIIPATSALTMGGTTGFLKNNLAQAFPILQVQGSSSGPVTQTFNGLTLNAGSSQISARGISGYTTTVALGTITNNRGSSIAFTSLNDGATGSQGVLKTNNVADSTGILGGWAVINASGSTSTSILPPNDYATVVGGSIVPYTYPAGAILGDGTTTFPSVPGENLQLNPQSATMNLQLPNAVTTDINTLMVSPNSGNRVKLNIGDTVNQSTGVLRLGVNGGLFTASTIGSTGSNTGSINLGFGPVDGGNLTAGGPNNNTAGTLNFQLNQRTNVYANLIDNGTGAVTLVVNAYNFPQNNTTLYLYGAFSNYSGGTYINGGRVIPEVAASFGTGPVTVGPFGQVYFVSGVTYANNFSLAGNAGNTTGNFNINGGTSGSYFDTPSVLRFNNNDILTGNITLDADSVIEGGNGTNLISGPISGNYNLYVNETRPGASPGNLTLSNSANSWGGNTIVQGGQLNLTVAGALPAGTGLTIAQGATVIANALPVANALSVNPLMVQGKLDLNNNDVIAHNSSLSAITAQLQLGFNGGAWNANAGIISTTAASDTLHLTALGVIVNDNGSGTPLYGSGGTIASTFGGHAPVDGDVLVKYTYYGDANLDGKVDGSDYSSIDSGFLTGANGWSNGDFNYDSVVNGSDYTLIDNAFNRQGAQLTAEIAGEVAGPASAVPEPATTGLLGIAAAGVIGRRRRHI